LQQASLQQTSPHYDDGAFSGASLDRPALQHLLADIRAGKIDIVLVYKVDRLTRSLADFAKLIELFDAHGVSSRSLDPLVAGDDVEHIVHARPKRTLSAAPRRHDPSNQHFCDNRHSNIVPAPRR